MSGRDQGWLSISGICPDRLPPVSASPHDAVSERFVAHVRPPARVADLGSGSGAWADHLVKAAFDVVVVDRARHHFGSVEIKFVEADRNDDFAPRLTGSRDAVTATI
jgi:hypothetical protein